MAKGRLSEAEMQKAVSDTKKMLDAQPKEKVKLYLPPDERTKLEAAVKAGKEVKWPNEYVGINGHNYMIPKGKEVEVPRSVKLVLEHAGLI